MYLIKLIKSNQVIIIMLYNVYVYVVYFVMHDSVLILLLSYGHHDWFNKVFLFLFCLKQNGKEQVKNIHYLTPHAWL